MQRIRTRDLFTLSGEIILAPEMRDRLKEAAGGNGKIGKHIKAQLMDILRAQENSSDSQSSAISADSTSSCPSVATGAATAIRDEDVFCVVVKIGYGKGNKNPVSDLTTFYMLHKDSLLDANKAHTVGGSSSSEEGSLYLRSNGSAEWSSPSLVGAAGGDGEWATATGECAMNEALRRRKWKVGVVPQGEEACIAMVDFIAYPGPCMVSLLCLCSSWCRFGQSTDASGV